MRRSVWLIIAVAGLLAFATAGWADPIGPDCGTCFGTIITLTYDPDPIDTNPTLGTETYDVTLEINTSGYNGDGEKLAEVALKVASASDLIDVSTVSGPAGWGSDPVLTGLSSNGCSGGSSGFFCHDGTDIDVPDGTLTWMYEVEVNAGKLLTGTGEEGASVKVRYIAYNEKKDEYQTKGITSEDITLQAPEPSATILLGLGLLGLGFLGRKRLKVRG